MLIADLHSVCYGKDQQRLIKKIAKQEPDIILLAGDIVDDKYSSDGAIVFMNEVTKIAPTYYVTGNHEYWSLCIDDIRQRISKTDVIMLQNTSTLIDIGTNTIQLFGVDDKDIISYYPQCGYSSWEQILKDVWETKEGDNFCILLSHRPEAVDLYQKYEYDLITAGHSHGGQVRIPFLLNGLYSPDQGIFPKYAGGRYTIDNTELVVSRGLFVFWKLPRIFNPPEIVAITIENN